MNEEITMKNIVLSNNECIVSDSRGGNISISKVPHDTTVIAGKLKDLLLRRLPAAIGLVLKELPTFCSGGMSTHTPPEGSAVPQRNNR